MLTPNNIDPPRRTSRHALDRTARLPVQTPTQAGRGTAWSLRQKRHHEAILNAEIRVLETVTRSFGTLPRSVLARLAHAERWHEGGFNAAVDEAIRQGRLRQRPFDFIAPFQPDDTPGAAGPPPVHPLARA
ncbi:MAG: hypothetical protein ACRDLP_02085 [Solirubrobacteraceae bacterium]